MSQSPIITSIETQDWPEEWYPRGVQIYAKRARSLGWDVRIGFSRGYVGLDMLRDVIGVWVDGFGCRAAAFWERDPEAKFSARKLETGVKPGELPSGMQWRASGTMIRLDARRWHIYASHTDLVGWLEAGGDVPDRWYENNLLWAQAHEEKALRAARSRPTQSRQREHA